MGYQIVVDTDYLLGVCKSINDTSSEIKSSIESMRNISNDLCGGSTDKNMLNFQSGFGDYLNKVNSVVDFYGSVTSTIDSLLKEYDDIDANDANELKKFIDTADSK